VSNWSRITKRNSKRIYCFAEIIKIAEKIELTSDMLARFVPFRFSGPTRHALTLWTAKNIPQRESKFAFSSGSLFSCTVHEHSKSQFSQHSSPVSIFLTNSTCINTVDGQKHSTARIRASEFESDPISPAVLQNSALQISRHPTTIFELRFMILGEN
jgi:hypothetical protein